MTDEDKELDFSHYMEKSHRKPLATTVGKKNLSFLHQSLRLRTLILPVIAIVLAGVLWYLLDSAHHRAEVVPPPGYRLIESANSPPHLEKVK